MNIPNRLARSIGRRAARFPAAGLKRPPLDYVPHLDRQDDPAKLANRVGFLTRGGAQASPRELERLMGTNDLVDEFYLERALLAAQPVARISIRSAAGNERGCATGFMVSPRLLITNEHVFGSADEAEPSLAEFNYRFNVAGRPEASFQFRLRPDIYFFNHEPLDFALVAVEPAGLDGATPLARFGYHRLIAESGKTLLKEWMNIIQHPGGNRRQFALRENQCIKDDDPDVLWYVSDTAQGSSGAPVLNDSFQVVALHHAGVPRRDAAQKIVLKTGQKVADLADADDAEVDWIANAGIRVSRICDAIENDAPEKNGCLAELKAAMEGGDILSTAYRNESKSIMNPNPQNAPVTAGRIVLGSLVLELNPTAFSAAAPAVTPNVVTLPDHGAGSGSGSAETAKEPIIDRDYSSRTGFDRNFLGVNTPLLKVTDPKVIAPMLDGQTVIPYQHFSVVLHKTRRLAIYTAANVDGRAAAKRPEAGKSYSRKALTGLSDSEQERWVLDPRVKPEFQIPDSFYTNDGGAFDKGHIVRREDVCFGQTFAEVQRANGDTFHVTNCSPQRGNYNRSNLGGIWGKLENYIGAQADTERFCIFAGPVLSPDDKTFVGKKDRVQLPTRFWKVVCALQNQRLQVFAFVLEQDVKDLPLEFVVDAEWKSHQVPLKQLEGMLKLVKFPKVYHDADQAKPKMLAKVVKKILSAHATSGRAATHG
jgi:endonuclease G, mitochondrial